MASSVPVPLSKKSQTAFITYYHHLQQSINVDRGTDRNRLEAVDRIYQREVDRSVEHQRAQAANKAGDTSRYQNITVPVVMPQVEAAVTYQASVFLTGHPLFGVVASPSFMDEALQLESVLESHSTRGGWVRDLMMFFRDGFKYNLGFVEVGWATEVTQSIETNLKVNIKEGVPKEIVWSGNSVRRLDPYNTFVDKRVAPSEVYKKGEYAGYTEFMSRIELKSFVSRLPEHISGSIVPAFESGGGAGADNSGTGSVESRGYYVPDINPALLTPASNVTGTDWMAWVGMGEDKPRIQYKDGYEVTTLYCKILPDEFGLNVPNRNTPQIYKLIIVNHSVIIYAERQTNAHAWLPILIGQPMEDGLKYQTKSLADNGTPFQELATSYMSSIIASRRRSVSDRTLYDPSRITSAAINSPNPSAKIPVRPAAYGKKIADSVYQFPYREDQASNSMSQISTLLQLSNSLVGQNQASQGQFVKGNKTLQEFESVMDNANGRDQLVSILYEYQVFVPMKHILKINTLQFQAGTTVYNVDREKEVAIDPVALRKATVDFKLTDGLIPNSKVLGTESLSVALQVMGSTPQLANGYNMVPMFSYLMKAQGAKLTEFEKSQEQIAYEQALSAWQGLAQLMIEKGSSEEEVTAKLPPQPKPEEFGYQPAGQQQQQQQGTGEQ